MAGTFSIQISATNPAYGAAYQTLPLVNPLDIRHTLQPHPEEFLDHWLFQHAGSSYPGFMHLCRKLTKDRENWQLALALFRQFDQSVDINEMADRVAFLASKLVSRFILTDDGTYECTEPAPQKVFKMRA